MGYYNELSIDTRTCGQADEDSRMDRRDGYTSRRRHSYSSAFTPQRRTREEWAKINAEHNERVRKTTKEYRKRGLNASGAALHKAGDKVQHPHGWAGVIVSITPNQAEDGALWAEVQTDEGTRFAPLAELEADTDPHAARLERLRRAVREAEEATR